MKVTDCCGVYSDAIMEDYGICPRCHEHCDFIEEGEEIYPDPEQVITSEQLRDRQIENKKLK